MGFLSGVLGAVKDDEAVKTYDKHLEKPLEKVLDEVNKNIGSGRAGLAASVDAVKEWLEGYDKEVKKRTEAVTTKLGTLTSKLSSPAGEYHAEVSSQASSPLATQLSEWTKTVKKIETEVENIKNGVNVLDSKLRDNVMHEMKPIQDLVQMLNTSGENSELYTRMNHVDMTFDTQLKEMYDSTAEWFKTLTELIFEKEIYIRGSVVNKCENLLEILTKQFSEIDARVDTMGKIRTETLVPFLENWLVQLESNIGYATSDARKLEANYQSAIVKGLESIYENVAKLKTNDIANEINAVYENVGAELQELGNVGEVLKLSVDRQLSSLSTTVDVTSLYGEIKVAVERYVDTLKSALTIGVDAAGTAWGYEGVTALASGMQKAGLEALKYTLEELARTNKDEMARKLQSALHNLCRLKKSWHKNRTEPDFEHILSGLTAMFNNAIDGAKKELNPVLEKAANRGTELFKTAMDHYINGMTRDDEDCIKIKIQKQVEKLFKHDGDDDVDESGEIQQNIDKLQANIKALLLAVTDVKLKAGKSQTDGVQNQVMSLTEQVSSVQQNVTDIKLDLESLNRYIQKAITHTVHTVDEAKKTLRTRIDSIRHEVISDLQNVFLSIRNGVKSLIDNQMQIIQSSFSTLTSAVRSLFAEQKKADLQALKGVVEEQKAEIEKIIKEDKRTGIKGLLKAVSGMKYTVTNPGHPSFENSDTLLGAIKTPVSTKPPTANDFKQSSSAFKDYYNNVNTYIDNQVKPPTSPSPTEPPTDPAKQLTKIKTNFDKLLMHLSDPSGTKKYNYDHSFTEKLASLKDATNDLSPSHFANPRHPELLDAVRGGLQGFVGEMGRVYVNGYDGGEGIAFKTNPLVQTNDDKKSEEKEKLTPYGEKLSKVCLTVVSNLHIAFKVLKKYCYTEQRFQKINKNTDVGMFFYHQGYDVSVEEKQKGELDKNVAATKIKKLLISDDYKHIYHTDKDTKLALQMLNEHLSDYYQVCHVSTFATKKRPCNVFEILCWLSGLPCSSVYEEVLRDAVSELFEDPNKQVAAELDGFEITVTDMRDDFLPAHPNNMLYDDTRKAVMRLCSKSYDVLTRIVGYGNAHTMYAVDYCANSLNFHYPSKGEDCLQMLLDVLSRLYPPLRFLYRQCSIGAQHYGWADCVYGQNVPSSKWQCNEHPKDKATSQVGCLPTCQANTQPNCQPNSPLMSYLNDCLPGHLPHHVSSIGCRAVCSTCPKVKKGMPCLTPLGFRGFSGSEKTGRELCEMLENFFANTYITTLFCLMTKPPSSLPEHFNFAVSLVNVLNGNAHSSTDAIKASFETTTKQLSIDLYKEPSKLTGALRDAYGSNQSGHNESNHIPKSADMSSLAMSQSCMLAIEDNVHCGPYLQTLFCDSYYYMAEKHTSVYLSWAVYLPWTLYDYLKSLFDSFSSISCQDWGCSTCVDGSSCKPGKHGDGYGCKCRSLVGCRGVMSTLYSYGFTFGDAKRLLSGDQRRYCRNLYAQLQNVLKSNYFTKLFEECDNFIWTIREPFTYLVLALWSLSLFYLLCVMVGRLDVLHIKSHLRIPSSHKITAQSLLAAAQVGRLAKISYLQP